MSKYESLPTFCEPLEWFREKERASFFILPKKSYIFNVEFGKKIVGKFADGTNKKFSISKKNRRNKALPRLVVFHGWLPKNSHRKTK